MAKLDINLSVNGADKAIKLKEQITSLEKANNKLRDSTIGYQRIINSLRKDEEDYLKTKQKLTEKIKQNSLAVRENNNEIARARQSIKEQNSSINSSSDGLSRLTRNVFSAYLAYETLRKSFNLVVNNGFEFNKSVEASKAGLVSLAVAIQDKNIPIMQRYANASREASVTMQELIKINSETPQSLDQTVQIYRTMYPSMKAVGVSSRELITLTKQLSIASAANGIKFQSLLAGVDGLASGTVRANSDLGRFLNSLGLTNEKLKQSTDIFKTINDATSSFKAPDTMTVAISKLSNAWNNLTGELTKSSFDSAKESLNALTPIIDNLTKKFHSLNTEIKSIYDIQNIKNIDDLKNSLEKLQEQRANLDKGFRGTSFGIGLSNLFGSKESIDAQKRNIDHLISDTIYKIKQLEKASLKQKKDDEEAATHHIKIITDEQQKLLDQAQALIDPTKPIIDRYNAMYQAIQAAPKGMFDETAMTKFFTSWQSAIDAVMKKQEQMTRLERDWSKEKQKINEDISLSNLNGYDKQLKALENWRDSELEKYSSITEAKAKIEEGFNSKLVKLNEEAAQNALKTMTSMYSDVNSLLSDLFDANDARAKKMAEVNKALHTAQMVMHVAEMVQSTAFTSLFVANEATKATAAGTTAVAVAAQSSPWTGMATAAAMAAMLASLGIALGAFGGNDTVSYTYDRISAQKANSGTGTTLGDTSIASKSITDSLKLMSDLAKPEYRLFTQMNNSLTSIDQKIAGVSTLLLQQGGFAVGEGANIASIKNTSNIISQYQGSILGGGLATIATDFISGALKKIIGDNFVSNIFTSISGTIGNIVSGIFGGSTSTSQKLYDYGLYFNKQLLNGAIDSIQGSAYQVIETRVKKSGGWFGSDSTSYYYDTYFKNMDASIKNQFQLILGNIYDTIVQGSKGLDKPTNEIIDTLNNFTVNLGKISFKGLSGQQIQDKLTSVFGKVSDQIVSDAFAIYDTVEKVTKSPIYKKIDLGFIATGSDKIIGYAESITKTYQKVGTTLDGFQQVGEGLYETMIRVSSGVQEADYYISMLGKSFSEVKYTDIINKQGNVALEALRQSIINLDSATYGANNGVIQLLSGINTTASDLYDMYKTLNIMRLQIESTGQSMSGLTSYMVLGAGGMSQLSDGLDAYYKNFLTSEEQVTLKTKEMMASFDALGVAMPTSNEQFKNLVQSIDTSTAAGQQLYGQVIALSGSFSDLTSQVKDTVNNLNNTIISTIDSITSSFNRIVTNSTVTLDKFKTSLNNALSLAGGNDRQALANALLVVQSQASALTNAANFSTLFDMQFAQAAATNRLNEIKQGALSQIDYLSNIANLLNGTLNVNVVSMSSTPVVNTKITPFANGGIVTKPTNALIGEAGYNEAVIPLKNPNDPLGQDKLQSQIYDLQQQQKESNGFMFTIAHEVIELNKLMRRITNGGDKMLVELGA